MDGIKLTNITKDNHIILVIKLILIIFFFLYIIIVIMERVIYVRNIEFWKYEYCYI